MSDVLRELATMAKAHIETGRQRDRLIVAAREQGKTWEQISSAAEMSRFGAIKAGQRGLQADELPAGQDARS